MLVPSKAIPTGRLPTGKLPRWASSLARSFVTVLPTEFAIQMLTPSKAPPSGPLSTGSVTTCDCVEVVCANEMPSARTTAHDAASNNPFVLRGVLLIPLSFLLMPFYSYRGWLRLPASLFFGQSTHEMDSAIHSAWASPGHAAHNWSASLPYRTFPMCFSLRSEEHTSELQSRLHLVCRLLLEKKK